jgi:hypothetical protein
MLSDLKYINELERWEDKDGTTWEEKKDYLQVSVLGFCSCGDPDEVMGYVYDMLRNVADCVAHNGKGIEVEYEDLPSMFFLYWANKQGFLEHGTTARCSWLTDLGKQLLADIEECIREDKQ